ncbi:MAG: DUF2341 domain-containing protein, partial [Candidatus Nanohaloarchaea archaeon]|nr:DUF2341 domain-containing protein [Candidatus Nanohaloarchaea archaeon]
LTGLALSLAGAALTVITGQQDQITQLLLGSVKETATVESVTCNGGTISFLINNTGEKVPDRPMQRVRVYQGGEPNYTLQVDRPDTAGRYPRPGEARYLNVSTGALFQPRESYSIEVIYPDEGFSFETSCRSGLDWWNLNWGYRRQIVVNNTAATQKEEAVGAVTLDTAALMDAGKLLPSCTDIRVVEHQSVVPYTVASGTCNTGSTTIYFNTSVAASSTEYDLYLYYGNIRAEKRTFDVPTTADPDLQTRLRAEESRQD